ncbi:hypothetical protein [Marispirochaeta aestuarii]|uniref:hypothetical protein n=1 Tax=Marispirochaeta aestuarii TaxID=1963862 RepID=UPI0029C619DC|nr:hypothetical protein [Marispirochaeta aestuarii]
MGTYSEKIQFERKVVDYINENLREAELIGLSDNSIEIWWRALDKHKNKYYKLKNTLEQISKNYGFILEESNLSRTFPVEEKSIRSVIESLKEAIAV